MYRLKVNRLGLLAGAFVYDVRGYDYGLANDDTRLTGIEHISVTLSPSGDYPCFTVAKHDLEEVSEEV